MPVQVPEHTWGVDIKKALTDYTHWSNHKFHQQVRGLGWRSGAGGAIRHTARLQSAHARKLHTSGALDGGRDSSKLVI